MSEPEMSDTEAKSKRKNADPHVVRSAQPAVCKMRRPSIRSVPLLITLTTTVFAVVLGWAMWNAYMGAPWTRDGTVRAYVVTMAPEVAGRIVELPAADNQFVRKGDLLLVIDPTNYNIALLFAEAAVEQTKAVAQNAQIEADRRAKLGPYSSTGVKQSYAATSVSAQATHQQAMATLDQARVNLERTRIASPVNGYVTNLLAQLGDYATAGRNVISIVDADSFWVDAYFEETQLASVHEGDPAEIKLMSYRQFVRGKVGSVARGINVSYQTRNLTSKGLPR
jgi:RND family efflux transporter MFP subunit